MDSVALACRLVLAAVFLVAALTKALDRPAFARALEQFGVPGAAVPALAVLVPLAELAVAVALIPLATTPVSAVAALILLGVFTAAVASVLVRGQEAECHCFGSVTAQPVGVPTLVRNAGLLAIAAVVVGGGPGGSATSWVGDLSATEAVLAAVCLTLAVGVVANGTFLFALFRQNGRLWAEIADLREKTGLRPDPPAIGEAAPSFTMPDLTGRMVSLPDLLTDDRGLLMLFTSPDCGACEPLLPRIGGLGEVTDDLQPVMLSVGNADDVRAKASEHGIDPVLVLPDFELPRSLGITGSPGAIVVDADGRVASAPALGTVKVDQLLSAWTGPPELVQVEGGG